MIDIAITSMFFLFCLIIGPLLMAQNLQLRRWSFLIVCLCLFLLSLNNLESLATITVFVAFPYCYLYIVRRWDVPLWPAIIIQLFLLIYINKYTWILSIFSIPIPFFITLVGVSYIFFRQLDILFQVKAKLVETVALIDYLNYLLSFWTILAGPIQRYREFITEFYDEKKAVSDEVALSCFHRAANGMLKILVVATILKFCSDYCYLQLTSDSPSIIFLLGIFYCFPLYVYFNFSGYCDVVIGMSRWAGFNIQENFNKPYLSRDMIEMWNRWHITLSQWVRDYIYQPLFKYLLSHPFRNHLPFCQYVSIFVTFFLVGIWHGPSINFVVFGLLQGFGMAVSIFYRDFCKKHLGKERYKLYYNNKWVENTERFITLNFWGFTFLFFEYDIFKISASLLTLIGV